ncbi:MAG: prolipoprotein diacylglyceryl transferase [Acidobacteriia bacterium]|nr:prolipoprotein diacylglyceryl transferase [Terriglobia bacterium]
MFPYIAQPVLEIAGQRFYAFGALVALALLVGCWFFMRRARREHLDQRFARIFIVSVAAVAFFVSHALKVVIYAPMLLREKPWSVLDASQDMYSFGGLVGGVLTAAWLMHRYRVSPRDRWRYLDNLAFAFTVGWIFGRAGCSLSHDHIGVPSNSLLAVRFPGGSRYDLGLLELIFTGLLAAVFFRLDRRPRPPGLFLGLFFLTYGIFRVWRDQLEVDVHRFLGSSPDQLFAVVSVAAGALILVKLARERQVRAVA